MEELIDEFLEELIDKKEITANERTDMKLTLLEAMPKEMTAETKTRVMSSLKSKMETPSANIFTDKGVNIVAVRTIANESVKEVVEAVEKEEQAKEEAEAKRDAKVAEALDTTILEADKKEQDVENAIGNSIEYDDGTFESLLFGNVSTKNYEKALEEVLGECGDNYTEDEIQALAEIKAATMDYHEKVAKAVEEGKTPEEARKIADQETFQGDQEQVKKQKQYFEDQNYIDLITMISDYMKENKLGFFDAIDALISERPDYFAAIENLDGIVTEIYNSFKQKNLTDEDLGIKQLKTEDDVYTRLDSLIYRKVMDGVNFFDAVQYVLEIHAIEFKDYPNIDALIEEIYQSLKILPEINKELLNEGDSQGQFEEVEETTKQEDSELNPKKRRTLNRNTPINNFTESKTKALTIATEELKDDKRKTLTARFNADIQPVVEEMQKNPSLVNISRSLYMNVQYIYSRKKQVQKEIRLLDEKDEKAGELPSDRKNIIHQRKRFINKAVEIYLSGNKSVYEILKEFDKYGDHFGIMPDDIIDVIEKINPTLAIVEKDLVKKHMLLEGAQQYLHMANMKGNVYEAERLERYVKQTEFSINERKKVSIEQKQKNSTYDLAKSEKMEIETDEMIKDAYDYSIKMEKLRDMQIIYTKIKVGAKEKGITMENYAKVHYFPKYMDSSKIFGVEFEEALKQSGNGATVELLPIVRKCMRQANIEYKEAIQKNISSLNKKIDSNENLKTKDDGIIEDLIEQDNLKRELNKSERRECVLSGKSSHMLELKKEAFRKEYVKRGLMEYFGTSKSLSEISQELQIGNYQFDINDLISGISDLGRKAGLSNEDVKRIAENEIHIHRNNIRQNGIKKLKENAIRENESDNLSKLESGLHNVENDNKKRMEKSFVFKKAILERVPNIEEALPTSKFANDLKKIHSEGLRGSFHGKKSRRVRFGHKEDDQQTVEESPKKGIGVMSVAKVVEANGTTSQEIVGEVAELNKIARGQEERDVNTEQRDA